MAYYLTYASSKLGYDARVVLAGREVNERVAEFTANKVIELVSSGGNDQPNASVLFLGLTFKPNVSCFKFFFFIFNNFERKNQID